MNHKVNRKKSDDKELTDQTARILYQKMGSKWYAFSEINNELFVGEISEDDVPVSRQDEVASLVNKKRKVFFEK